MQELRHLDKQFVVLPAFMLAINSVCYSMIPNSNTNAQPEKPVMIYQQQMAKELPQHRVLCAEKLNQGWVFLISTLYQTQN